MERAKRSLSELSDRQKRRRVAESVRKELESCGTSSEESVDTEEAYPLSPGQQAVAAHASFSGEFEYQRASECESESSDTSGARNNLISEHLCQNPRCEFPALPPPLQNPRPSKPPFLYPLISSPGPVVLRNHLEKRFYGHFIKLSCVMTILASPKFSLTHCDLAESLLREFVSGAGTLYEGVYVYNMHSLIHLTRRSTVRPCQHLLGLSL
ncbi:hypothetical protein ISCGN_002024 [Ixodes scapularis]